MLTLKDLEPKGDELKSEYTSMLYDGLKGFCFMPYMLSGLHITYHQIEIDYPDSKYDIILFNYFNRVMISLSREMVRDECIQYMIIK